MSAPDLDRVRALLADPALAALLSALDGDGEEARVVGGAVRDALLGEDVSDVDICTSALPQEVARRVEAFGWRAIPTGIEHGTLTILVQGRSFEATTLRVDVETFGRKANVRFGRDFRADALRRDFTLNALSLDRAGRVHDYAGGLDDLAARRVRFIGEPRQRIREDYLRILRFFRFHARFAQGPLDADGMAAAIAEREGIAGLSRERMRAETMKLLMAPGLVPTLEAMDGAGFLLAILGAPARVARLAEMIAAFPQEGAAMRLGALGVEIAEDAARLRKRLRLSNEETDRLEAAATVAQIARGRAPPDENGLKALLFDHGRRAAEDGLALACLDAAPAQRPAFLAARDALAGVETPRQPFSGDDLLKRGVAPGRRLGQALKRLQADWIRAGFPADPARLAALMDAVVSEG